MMAGAPLLTLREVATHLRVELRTVQRWAKDGTMPARKIVGHWRVDRGALEAWIGEQECPSTSAAASGGAEFRLPDASRHSYGAGPTSCQPVPTTDGGKLDPPAPFCVTCQSRPASVTCMGSPSTVSG